MELALIKRADGSFIPVHDSDYESARKIKTGEERVFKTIKNRNYKFHKKVFALFNAVFENQEQVEEFNNFRALLTIEAGYYTDIVNHVTGEVHRIPKSLSYATMDEFEFQEFYAALKQTVIRIYKWDDSTLDEIIESFL